MMLSDYIIRHMNDPFIWGSNDCVLFAANWIRLATGKDYLNDIEPWFSMRQAIRIQLQHGGLEAIVDRKLERINQHVAMDGDIAFHQDGLRIYTGRNIVGPGPGGLVFFDRAEAKCAWRCA